MIAFGLSFSICYGTSVGLGRHEVDLLPEWRSTLKKCEYAFSVLYVCFSFGARIRAKNLAESRVDGDKDLNLPLLLDPGQKSTDFQMVDHSHPRGCQRSGLSFDHPQHHPMPPRQCRLREPPAAYRQLH